MLFHEPSYWAETFLSTAGTAVPIFLRPCQHRINILKGESDKPAVGRLNLPVAKCMNEEAAATIQFLMSKDYNAFEDDCSDGMCEDIDGNNIY